MENVSIIIPAFNEEDSIAEVVTRIRQSSENWEIIVVDDGSSDNTAAQARQAGATVISHPYNVGNGAAVRTGVRAAKSDRLVMLDGDLQHPPDSIETLVGHLDRYHMVVGARRKFRKFAWIRAIGNRLLILFARLLTGAKIQDLTSGFRAVRRENILPLLHLFPNRYSYPTTLTLCFIKSGLFIKYITLDSIQDRKKGKSGVRPLRDGIYFANIILRIIILFEPQKVFVPIGTFFSLAGIGMGLYTVLLYNTLQESAILLIIVGIFLFLFGLTAEQISALRRERL